MKHLERAGKRTNLPRGVVRPIPLYMMVVVRKATWEQPLNEPCFLLVTRLFKSIQGYGSLKTAEETMSDAELNIINIGGRGSDAVSGI